MHHPIQRTEDTALVKTLIRTDLENIRFAHHIQQAGLDGDAMFVDLMPIIFRLAGLNTEAVHHTKSDQLTELYFELSKRAVEHAIDKVADDIFAMLTLQQKLWEGA